MTIWQRIPLTLKILVPGLIAVYLISTMKPKPEPDTTPPPEKPKPSVNRVYASPVTESLTITAQGTVEPRRKIDLIAQVAGEITHVHPAFVAGGAFNNGDILIKIEPIEYELALARANAELAQAEMQFATEKGLARQAKQQWRDLKNEEANRLFLRKPQLAAAAANVDSAKASVKMAKLNLQRTTVKAPFTGRIINIHADLGQIIGKNNALAEIIDTSVAQVTLALPQSHAALIKLHHHHAVTSNKKSSKTPAPEVLTTVTLSAQIGDQQFEWPGSITRSLASINQQSRMYYVVAEIQQPYAFKQPLPMGLFVTAHIKSKPLTNLIKLPKEAVFKRNQLYWLNNNIVNQKQVNVLSQDQSYVWFQDESIEPNTAIVADRQGYILPGVEVLSVAEAQTKVNKIQPTATAGE
ncbi:efflux RND transporter periplasmic adaptor subunit [Algibacillus agarilyticus]|uniref:efflux RND transporter periplasmic adaptor subunit n=1 Tax=Algibacillus agarilyticus TaxID=2234133 RepID=UPI000DD0089A|nr:efflux RND transporter periplasmic adaptor subunit [Algibacillus agarilyticus]